MSIANVVLVLAVLLVYAFAYERGKRQAHRKMRAPHEPCWRCDGSGIERTK